MVFFLYNNNILFVGGFWKTFLKLKKQQQILNVKWTEWELAGRVKKSNTNYVRSEPLK